MTRTLFLTRNSPTNTVLCNEQGFAVYKIETPWKWRGKQTTISKVVPNSTVLQTPLLKAMSSEAEDDEVGGNENWDEDDTETVVEPEVEVDAQDRYAGLASIEWSFFGHSQLHYGEFNGDMKTFMPRAGFLRKYRVFTASNGVSYRWALGLNRPELVVNTTSETPVLKFHRRRLGVVGKPRPASIEILPEAEYIVDDIVVTWVYVEKLRREREHAAKRPGGG